MKNLSAFLLQLSSANSDRVTVVMTFWLNSHESYNTANDLRKNAMLILILFLKIHVHVCK